MSTSLVGCVVWLYTVLQSALLREPPQLTMRMTHIFHRNTGGSNLHAMHEISLLDYELGATLISGPIQTREQEIWRLTPESRGEYLAKVEAVGNGDEPCGRVSAFSREWQPQWHKQSVRVPNVEDKDSLITIASLAANAYVPTPHEGDWTNVSREGWQHDPGFGWMGDGIRGYVFASSDSKTVVVSIKGTSAAVLDDGGPTAPNDKINDNLFFSCCCSRISYMWNTVCDCYMGQDKHSGQQMCDENCLESELFREDRYYRGILDIFQNVTSLYPDANIWLTGHSLGGALSSMLGRTYGLPTVTFEAPGDDLAVRRLHLPRPPGQSIFDDHVWQFGHNADPIFMGECNGAGSTCWLSGYAMESRCHTGLQCMYDVVGDLGWHSSIANHRIHVVIEDVLTAYNVTAVCRIPPECVECEGWQFVDLLQEPMPTLTTPGPSTTTLGPPETDTATETGSVCLTRAWYGRCLDWGVPTTEVTAMGALATSAFTTSAIAFTTSTIAPTSTPTTRIHSSQSYL